ncbi:MAG TPA: CDGSH iron-sulfur domain-containing protein [Bacteroidales bacterium]|nr:CDGSH iron-sulfur domain-containing protein [Bacteroidales bacterium]
MKENNEIESQAIIEVIDFGPLKITGNFLVKDLQRDLESSPGEVWLCRCGKSGNKPYCDGSHQKMKIFYRHKKQDEPSIFLLLKHLPLQLLL